MSNLYQKHPQRPIRVRDAGCADARMVHSRFVRRERILVQGLDKNAAAIARAKRTVGETRASVLPAQTSPSRRSMRASTN